jgi:hypothetical protein
MHWHTITVGGPGSLKRMAKKDLLSHLTIGSESDVVFAAREIWHRSLRGLGPQTFAELYRGGKGDWKNGIARVDNLMQMPGAEDRAFCGSVDDGAHQQGAWLRYLQDHASKSKQEQVAASMGRHWGVVGRRLFRTVGPSSVERLTDVQLNRFLRAYQRLATPSVRCECAPFGRRLGFRCRRGSGHGSAVVFGRTETHLRLVEWARTT